MRAKFLSVQLAAMARFFLAFYAGGMSLWVRQTRIDLMPDGNYRKARRLFSGGLVSPIRLEPAYLLTTSARLRQRRSLVIMQCSKLLFPHNQISACYSTPGGGAPRALCGAW